jgi:signal transduction histidine kinase
LRASIVTNYLGGRLNLESEPGAGTKIQILLPRVAPAAVSVQ